MATTNYSWNLPVVGGSEDTWGQQLNDNWSALDALLGGTDATEFAILDGATVTTAELNHVSGVTGPIQDQISGLAAVTISAGDGLTGGGDLSDNRIISHADTSSQASVNNSGTTFIQDITLDAYGHVTGIGSATVAGGIGDGQTWQRPSRSPGVSYQNTTGKPIQVAITYYSVNNDNGFVYTFQVSQNNSTWVTISQQGERWCNHAHFAVVPDGYYYRQSGWNNSGGGSIIWAELR